MTVPRRRHGATIKFTIHTNPKNLPTDSLSDASKLEVHLKPPTGMEIQLTATISDTNPFDLKAVLPKDQSVIDGLWDVDAYGEWGSGSVVKIGKTSQFQIDPKYKFP